jgi:hypothetical protein
MSTPYANPYPASSWPAPGHQGAIQGPTPDDKLTNSMASMAIVGGSNQPYSSFQRPPVVDMPLVYPIQQPPSFTTLPAAQTNGYGTIPQAYGVPPVTYQTTNSSPSQINTLPQHHGYQSPHQGGDSQAPNSPYLVSTTSIQASPGSYAAATNAPTSTPVNCVPSLKHPPINCGVQCPSQYPHGPGASSSQSNAQAKTEQPQNANASAVKGKGLPRRPVNEHWS